MKRNEAFFLDGEGMPEDEAQSIIIKYLLS